MEVIEQMMKDIHEAITGPSLFCEITQNGRILAFGLRLYEAQNQIISGDWGRGEFMITQRKADRTIIHDTVRYPCI
jgi:hypothetical protein